MQKEKARYEVHGDNGGNCWVSYSDDKQEALDYAKANMSDHYTWVYDNLEQKEIYRD